MGSLTISGGVLKIDAVGTAGKVVAGILFEGLGLPTFVNTNLTIRSSAVALLNVPNLNAYGREYEITVSEDIDCDTPLEYDPENIADYKYFKIHGWYSVVFDANGGTGEMQSSDGLYGSFILPENGFTAPNGKKFKGWSLSENGEVIEETTILVQKDTTLYAVWEDEGSGNGELTPDPNDPNHTHNYGDEWKISDGKHYRECACGKRQYEGEHIDSNKNGLCDVCGSSLNSGKNGLKTGVVVGIVVGGVAVLGGGGFSLYWFVIKKRRFKN